MPSTTRKHIIGNWKMNGLQVSAKALTQAVVAHVEANRPSSEIALCPPATLLIQVGGWLTGSAVALGGQDCHSAPEGAFTGDVSALMLKDAGCRYVIVGHSERRVGHGETSDTVRAKAAAVIEAGMVAVICVGETLEERRSGRAEAVVQAQLAQSVPKSASPAQFLLAYEPVWAIGSGLAATAGDITAMHGFILGLMPGARVLYGGSVNPDNAAEILALPAVGGVLVGGASLKAEQFCAIIDAA